MMYCSDTFVWYNWYQVKRKYNINTQSKFYLKYVYFNIGIFFNNQNYIDVVEIIYKNKTPSYL